MSIKWVYYKDGAGVRPNPIYTDDFAYLDKNRNRVKRHFIIEKINKNRWVLDSWNPDVNDYYSFLYTGSVVPTIYFPTLTAAKARAEEVVKAEGKPQTWFQTEDGQKEIGDALLKAGPFLEWFFKGIGIFAGLLSDIFLGSKSDLKTDEEPESEESVANRDEPPAGACGECLYFKAGVCSLREDAVNETDDACAMWEPNEDEDEDLAAFTCEGCGALLGEKDIFCENCGLVVEGGGPGLKDCTSCDAVFAADQTICPICGADQDAPVESVEEPEVRACVACGVPLAEDILVCPSCGQGSFTMRAGDEETELDAAGTLMPGAPEISTMNLPKRTCKKKLSQKAAKKKFGV